VIQWLLDVADWANGEVPRPNMKERPMQYEMRIKVTAAESPLRSGWYAKIDLEGDLVETVNSTLTGNGSNAVQAVQAAFANLAANGSTYAQMLIEAALMHGTRTARRLDDGKKKR
jgi:hypothetical protein